MACSSTVASESSARGAEGSPDGAAVRSFCGDGGGGIPAPGG